MSDPTDVIRNLGERFRRIKLGSGVVGKTSYIVWGLIPLWGIVLGRLSENLMQNLFLVGGGFAITLFVVWWVSRTHIFAEANPSIALLEGAELIEYQKFEAQVKGVAAVTGPQSQLAADPKLPSVPPEDPNNRDAE